MSKKIAIYQVLGNLKNYGKSSFKIDGSENVYKDLYLSSEALSLKYRNEDGFKTRIIFLCPISLAETVEELEDKEELKNRIAEDLSTHFLKSKDTEFEVKLVDSIGIYEIDEKEIQFKSYPENITAQIFFDMCKRDANYVIADISTGHNMYISSLLDALRSLVVKKKLEDIGRDEINFKALYAVTEPIVKNVRKDLYLIFLKEVDVKAFFDLPFKERGNEISNLCKLERYIKKTAPNVKCKIGYKCRETSLNTSLSHILKNLVLAFNAIKYNTPLIFSGNLIDLTAEVSELEEKIKEIILKFSAMKRKNDTLYEAPRVDVKGLLNLFFALSLYEGIKGLASVSPLRTTKDLQTIFSKVYEKLGLGLNKRFLERDIREIEFYLLGHKSGEWETYGEIKRKLRRCSDEKRNFFAHSGLEENIVEVKIEDGEVLIRYKGDEEIKNKIKRWLLNPESE